MSRRGVRGGIGLRAAASMLVAFVALVALVAGGGTSLAAPPPPPNPPDSALDASRADVTAKGSVVGALVSRLANLENQLSQLQDALEAKREDANRAFVDLQSAQDAAARAQQAAEAAGVEADAAGTAIEDTHAKLDQFVGALYQQGAEEGAASVLLGARSPADALERATLMDAVSRDQLVALDAMERARVEKANKDSAARAARLAADAQQARATLAKQAADAAVAAAQHATAAQVATVQKAEAQRGDVERQLAAAQQRDTDLRAQRRRYVDWQAQVAAQAAAAASRVHGTGPRPGGGGGGAGAQAVIDRAVAQLGVSYAWGGGSGRGPTFGIRDGGVADLFNDFRKVGFDCSGLMTYAFAGAGISLPHYSGYQYTAGRHVPLSQVQPGDMLFWGADEGIHHVALYIGGGRMVEAPFSGSRVRVVPVRYGNGLLPFATRMF